MEKKRVVITGLGALTPIGNDLNAYWESLTKGISGAGMITRFNPNSLNFSTKFACEIKDYKNVIENYISLLKMDGKKSVRFKGLDACTQYGLITSNEAIRDSKIEPDALGLEEKEKIGVIWGTGIGGLRSFEQEILNHAKIRPDQSDAEGLSDEKSTPEKKPRFSPRFIPNFMANATPAHISIKYGFKGPSYATVSACTSAANAIADAFFLISMGKLKIALTGGSEASITECGVGGFNALKALSTRNDDPKKASRPFDKHRDGFVLGEGAACLILEEYEHAKKRGANIYAEIDGIGMSSDAYDITAPHPDSIGVMASMKDAFNGSVTKLEELEYINTHGTSTGLGDLAEIQAISKTFKEHMPNISITSTKSMTGHLLGAAGAIEAVASILSLKYGIIPPTINQLELDQEIKAMHPNIVSNDAQKRDIKNALSNTFGFGGHNVSILFKKPYI